MASVQREHDPLFVHFQALITQAFLRKIGLADSELVDYLADMLAGFAHFDHIFPFHDISGRRLEEIAEMLMDGDVIFEGASFIKEREVHKHIGNFTLFWTGVFPEFLRELQAPRRKDHLIDYVEQGKSSYYIASTFDYGQWAQEARIHRCLSHTFETVAMGLKEVRSSWEEASRQVS